MHQRSATAQAQRLGSIGGRIAKRITVLFIISSLMLGAATLFVTHQALFRDVDNSLGIALRLDWGSLTWQRPTNSPWPSTEPGTTTVPGQQISAAPGSLPGSITRPKAFGLRSWLPLGSLSVLSHDDLISAIRVGDAGQLEPLSQETTQRLLSVPRDGEKHDIYIAEFGAYYRVVAIDTASDLPDLRDPESPGQRFAIEAQSLRPIRLTLFALVLLFAVLITLFTSYGIWNIRRIVAKGISPITDLASSANKVTKTDLVRGVANLRELRVPEAQTQDEVHQVASAFNTMLGHVEDAITERDRSAATLRQFVADASHELRNPLAAIRGYAEITMKYGVSLPSETKFAVSRIDAESRRMSALVEDLLLLARLDSCPSLEFSDVNITEMLLNAVADARVAGPQHHWKLDLPLTPVSIRADHQRLYQVLLNLLTNSRVHTPAGTVVTTTLQLTKDEVVITVADNGPGIPAELADTIFERFTRGDQGRTSTSAGSVGLGLSIAASIVKAHQGTIFVTSEPGSRFTFSIPILRSQA